MRPVKAILPDIRLARGMRRITRAGLVALLALGTASGLHAQSKPDPALITKLQRLAAKDNAEAIYHLGMAYLGGLGVPQDKAKALEAFRKATDLGDPLAAYQLGNFYDGQGDGLVGEDKDLALKYKLVGAEAGYAQAQQDVALLYAARGDYLVAVDWLKKASDQGLREAIRAYSAVHNGAEGVEPDPAIAAAYFRLYLRLADDAAAEQAALAEFEKKLSLRDKERADKIVTDFKPEPTALTLRALAGQRAARTLVGGTR